LSLLRPTIRAEASELWASWNPRRKSDAIDDFFRARKPEGAVTVSANWRDNPWFPSVLYDAGKYRLLMKAKDAVAAKPVPPVQRPGMARSPAEREHADLRTLNARLSSSGDIKDAVALYHARKSNRR
jgi:hypothetical protein